MLATKSFAISDNMGYFSNGTEGQLYEAQYCDKCAHQDGCTVWLLHMLKNYEDCNNKESPLHILIPRGEKGENKKCTMFIAARTKRDGPFVTRTDHLPIDKLTGAHKPAPWIVEWFLKRKAQLPPDEAMATETEQSVD